MVEEYRLVVEQFFEWMYGRLREIHKPDFQVVAGYQQEIFKLRKGEFESSIRRRLKLSKKGIGGIIDVLSPLLTIADTADMASLVKTPKAWVEEAVRRIEMFVQLPASLKVELTAGL